jgi:hypothetical protein
MRSFLVEGAADETALGTTTHKADAHGSNLPRNPLKLTAAPLHSVVQRWIH